MSYVVIARRWRPQLFEDIVGQDHVSKTLSNAIANNRIAHAYIFTGPRGVGKTSAARILAKAVNCEKGPIPTPCNTCASCEAIINGNALDVLEIDGASNRGIDEVRNLRENIRFTPTLGKYRIYIIDEVHMLTKEAFNALLKTLEEPPSHALFIFATTEIHKVPATILSRCQRFDFKRIPLNTIMNHLRHIATSDSINVDEDALLQIAKKADGSMRDAQSILDQIISYSGNNITFQEVAQALGVINQEEFFRVSDLAAESNIRELILLSRRILAAGYDLNEFLLGLEEHFRNILISKVMNSPELVDVSELYHKKYMQAAEQFGENDIVAYLKLIANTISDIKWSQQPHLKFELGLIKLAKMPASKDINDILEKLSLLKKKTPEEYIIESPGQSEKGEEEVEEKLTLGQLEAQWSDILSEVHRQKPTLANVLNDTSIEKYLDGKIFIRINGTDPFHKSMIEKNRTFLEQTISEVLKTTVRVHLRQEKTEFPEKQRQNNLEERKKDLEKLKAKHPAIAKLVDELDLDLI
jgi:DNA polymerase-3 subunit gamma/tau